MTLELQSKMLEDASAPATEQAELTAIPVIQLKFFQFLMAVKAQEFL